MCKELIDATDYPKFDIESDEPAPSWSGSTTRSRTSWAFRDNAYRSLMTGTMSPPHHTPWLKAMDDSHGELSGKVAKLGNRQ